MVTGYRFADPDTAEVANNAVFGSLARSNDYIDAQLLDVANDCQAPSCSPGQFSLGHKCLLVNWRPKCQQTPSVL